VRLSDRICVVTGASSGIGRATALALAQRGNTVVATARRANELATLVDAIAPTAPKSFALPGDLAVRAFAESVVAETVARCGRIDVLVNNAAMPMHKLATRTTPDDVESALRLNFLSPVWITSAALPHMLRARSGAIVNVSSFSALVVPPREGAYAASKAALDAWSEGLSIDLAGSGVHVALVHPGPIETEIWAKRQEQSGYAGKRWPAADVAAAIVRLIEQERRDAVVPARNPSLVAARVLRHIAPGLLRLGMRKVDPPPADAFDASGGDERGRGGR
jgi:short-subunit dehydrogenase